MNGTPDGAPATRAISPDCRAAIYVIGRGGGKVDDYVAFALRGLRSEVTELVVVLTDPVSATDRNVLESVATQVLDMPNRAIDHRLYLEVASGIFGRSSAVKEVIFTGDGWFGPVLPLREALERTADTEAALWQMVESADGQRESFPSEGFPGPDSAWIWVASRRTLWDSPRWQELADLRVGLSAQGFYERVRHLGLDVLSLFSKETVGSHDPSIFAARALLDDGCPIVDVAALSSYPPQLDRFGSIGRETVEAMAALGYPTDHVWRHLARTVPPAALNAIGGMLEILPGRIRRFDPDIKMRIAVVIHVSDPSQVPDALQFVTHLPFELEVFVTTTDGMTAAQLQPLLEDWSQMHGHAYELRVTPASPGRDMSDFFVACRDVLQPGRFDLVVKLHCRMASRKTVNVRRYFRRYQYENLLDTPEYAHEIVGLFQQEPHLGVVFPPMMHIGYGMLGKAWAGLRHDADRLCQMLGIAVPLDVVSPLAPFGGMWVGRPEALVPISGHPWSYGDYSPRIGRRYHRLAHVQERIIAVAAAQAGYYARTVLTAEHASISHTALEYKVDEMFSTTRGYPVEQIRLLHRAGPAGHGGPVALLRMYTRINHPGVAEALRPLYRLAYRAYSVLRRGRGALRNARFSRPAGG